MSNLIDAIRQAWPVLKDDEKKAIESLFMGEKPMWVPFPGPQVRAIDSQADELFYGGSAGGGKGGPLYYSTCNAAVLGYNMDCSGSNQEKSMQEFGHLILTPFGFKLLDDIKVGDAVINPDGTTTKVIAVHDIRRLPCYRVSFQGGHSVIVDQDHLWAVKRSGCRTRARATRGVVLQNDEADMRFNEELVMRYRIMTTPQLADAVDKDGRSGNWSVPLMEPANLQIPPGRTTMMPAYVLGVLLGDGILGETPNWSKPDGQIACMVSRALEEFGSTDRVNSSQFDKSRHSIVGGETRAALRSVGLIGARSWEKFIPKQYLSAPLPQRWALMNGLMDTDGYADARGQCYYCTTSPQLRDDFVYLAGSLGFVATATPKAEPSYIYEGEKRIGRPAWDIYITGRNRTKLFTLDRKRDRSRNPNTECGRTVISVEPIDEPLETRCISVAHPNGLYVTNGFIVTHNSEALLGLALTRHRHSIIFRREYPQLRSMVQRSMHLIGQKGTYNSQSFFWKLKDGRTLEFGACQLEKDTQRYMGRPHDFIGFDEASNFLKQQVIFLMGWNRPADGDAKQRCRVVLTGNPPTSPEGRWIVEEFAPWLDPGYSDQAEPGELRWYAREPDSGLIWRKSPDPIRLSDGEIVRPKSRTFIPARVDDNPVLMASGYKTVLQGLPEPLRSQLLYGDFSVQGEDDPFQVIPTSWVHAAQERWTEDGHLGKEQEVLGVDVARGGSDWTILSARHGNWFAPLLKYKGRATPDGHSVAALVRNALHSHNVAVNIDVIGIGSAAFDVLREGLGNFRPFDGRKAVERRDRSGQLGFLNMRAWSWWALREALDPNFGSQIQLPPDPQLLADLCTPRWHASPRGIQIETKDDIHKRIGRSPDAGDAVVLAFLPFYDFTYPTRENQPEVRRSKLFDLERPSSIRNRGWLGLRPK